MKHLIIAMSLLALASCKDNKKEEALTKTSDVEQSVEATNENHNDKTSSIYENAWVEEIEMNSGKKWAANTETNQGVQKMQKSLNTFTTNTLDEYHKLAQQLNSDKNYVIKNCTMKGASHDNLHVWLLPLMAKIEALSETKTVADAAKIKESISENVSAYNNYFE